MAAHAGVLRHAPRRASARVATLDCKDSAGCAFGSGGTARHFPWEPDERAADRHARSLDTRFAQRFGLRQAELGPDPSFFEVALADDAVLVAEDCQPFSAKSKVVDAHRPRKGPKCTRVEMSDMTIVDHRLAAVVTCKGFYENAQTRTTLRFMRVWVKKDGRWQIVAGSVSQEK